MARSEDFEHYYYEVFGDRWPELRSALLTRGESLAVGTQGKAQSPYYIDPASAEPVRALEVQPGLEVLDMCAAPGGKTLLIAEALAGEGVLVANDRSAARRARLHRVLDQHLSPNHRAVLSITGHDATRWGLYERDRYDRILLDAPCSSEAHVLSSPKALKVWSAKRPRRLANQQYAMLRAAIDALRPGGLLVYSTCALAPAENESVVARLLQKKNVDARWTALPWEDAPSCAEQIGAGYRLWPDRCSGAGPIFLSLLTKRAGSVPQG
jgi:16S rRNA C967 or C1407 C5-methylase (RsmB/RsmF family)